MEPPPERMIPKTCQRSETIRSTVAIVLVIILTRRFSCRRSLGSRRYANSPNSALMRRVTLRSCECRERIAIN